MDVADETFAGLLEHDLSERKQAAGLRAAASGRQFLPTCLREQ